MRYEYAATVANVVDGDTVDLIVDCGFRHSFKDRFRLDDIDTPERGDVGWGEATAALKAMLPIGARVRVVTEHPTKRDPSDKYGRWLATIYVADREVSVNVEMVSAGHAGWYMR